MARQLARGESLGTPRGQPGGDQTKIVTDLERVAVVPLGNVEVVRNPAARQPHVTGFPGQPADAVDERDIDRGALGLVAGHRIAVVEVPGRPSDGDRDLLFVLGSEDQGVPPWVYGGDAGSGAVEQAEVVVVGDHEYAVAGPVLALPGALAGGDCVKSELPVLEEPFAGGDIELGHVGSAHGEHHHTLGRACARSLLRLLGQQPQIVADDPVGQLVGGCGVDPVVLYVGVEGGVGVAGTEIGQGAAFPGLTLAVVARELDGVGVAGQCGEQSAGPDLGELCGIADEYEGAVGGLGVGEQCSQGRVSTMDASSTTTIPPGGKPVIRPLIGRFFSRW